MSDEPKPVLEGFFTTGAEPALLGSRCTGCGTYYFPSQKGFCRNPDCQSSQFEEAQLSRRGKLWSFTNACYQPPEPYCAPDPFESFAVAAVELEHEKMIVLGQVAEGVGVEDLRAGQDMELILEVIPDAVEPAGKLTWKWKPAA